MAGPGDTKKRAKSAVRFRRSGPKSRDGCTVCKARHVKCDETRPQCRQCTATKRKCAYTTSSTLTFVRFSPSPKGSLSNQPDSDPSERRALSYFQHRAISELGGVCSPELWLNFILPVSHRNRAIKHAVVALVTLHEEYTSSQHPFPSGSRDTLVHYGKAVNELLQLETLNRPDAVDIALVSSIIFSSLEILRGHYHSALAHVLSGKRILEEEKRDTNHTKKVRAIPRRLLEDIFQTMETQVMSIGDRSVMPLPIASRPAKPAIPPLFRSMQDAFQLLETLQHQILHFFSHAAQLLVEMNSQPEAFEMLAPELGEFEQLFEEWQRAFDLLLKSAPEAAPNGSNSKDPAVLLLNILRTGFSTIFPTTRGRHATESDFDKFTDEFEKMVDWAEAYIQLTLSVATLRTSPDPSSLNSVDQREGKGVSASPEGPGSCQAPLSKSRTIAPRPTAVIVPTFSMSTGIIPSLFMCGARCRDPRIRRKALHLLQACNRREGLWDSRQAARIVEMVIRIEEANAVRASRKSGRQCSITHASQIPETVRVVVMGVEFGAERTGQVTYQVKEACPEEEGGVRTKLIKETISS